MEEFDTWLGGMMTFRVKHTKIKTLNDFEKRACYNFYWNPEDVRKDIKKIFNLALMRAIYHDVFLLITIVVC